MSTRFPIGVLHGEQVSQLFKYAQENQFALPSMNVTSTNTVNSILEVAKVTNSPAIIQISFGGAQFYAGKSLPNENYQASITGAIAMAQHVYHLAKQYEVTVILHSDHAPRQTLPWVDGMLDADEKNMRLYGHPLFSSHMLDLSVEPIQQNIATCKQYLERMSAMGITLELEIGITGGEEDGIDHSNADQDKLYTRPEDIAYAYEQLSQISPNFTIAAAFGNVHGVYKPGNVKLRPEILSQHQQYVQQKYSTPTDKPLTLVFHGGSGSPDEKIQEAISYGVVKFNVDTDTQWAFWDGVRTYEQQHHPYLQGQIGNPEGEDKPNKKFYDPRAWLRSGEQSIVNYLTRLYQVLNATNRNL